MPLSTIYGICPPAGRRWADPGASWLCTDSRRRLTGGDTMDADILEQVLPALARGIGGQAGQRAWTALPGMTARICGRFSAEARAAAAACAGGELDQAALSGMATL